MTLECHIFIILDNSLSHFHAQKAAVYELRLPGKTSFSIYTPQISLLAQSPNFCLDFKNNHPA